MVKHTQTIQRQQLALKGLRTCLGSCQASVMDSFAKINNPLHPSVAFLYPLKTSENLKAF